MTILIAGARRRDHPEVPHVDTTPYAMPTSAPYNVPSYAITPTYDGTGSAIHPSVLDFKQINGGTWRGWRYWMAVTPFYGSNDQLENPSILVSRDGYTWQEPLAGLNPIYPTPPGSFNADTEIEYDADTDELVLIYKGPGPTFNPRTARSADGITWPATASEFVWPTVTAEQVSPALIRLGPSSWACWTNTTGTKSIHRWTTTNPTSGVWSGPTVCTGFGARLQSTWHHDVVLHDGIYRMLVSEWGTTRLIFAASSLDGVAWTYDTAASLLVKVPGSWDSGDQYRPTLTPHENGTHMRVWYSAVGSASWRIGYTQIPISAWPAPPAP